MKHPTNNVFGGFLTIYMVATAWATARPEREQLAFWIGLDLFLQPGARDFRQTTHCTASLAHVLRVVYRTGSFFLGQQQVFPAWLRGRLCFWCGPAAAGAADFLDDSSSLQRRVRENINAPRSATLPSTWLVSICSYGRCAVADFCGPAVPSE